MSSATELPRIHIPRTWVNKGKKEGRGYVAPALPVKIVIRKEVFLPRQALAAPLTATG
jgi:hypothetical protein